MTSSKIVSILYGIAVFAILRKNKSYNNLSNVVHKAAANSKEDIISQLPDHILISIISRMPTKFAIRTSILSKRWMNLYKFVTIIDLCCRDLFWHYDYERSSHYPYINFCRVNNYLRLHSGSKVHSFYIRCCAPQLSKDLFDQFIHYLGRLGVEKLVFHLRCSFTREPSEIPFYSSLLSKMPALKYLQLSMCPFSPGLQRQCSSLQILSLYLVSVQQGALECILSNCLNLHSVGISNSKISASKLRFCGPNLRLKCLYIVDCRNVEEIELYASNLVTFELRNLKMVNFIFDHVPLLQNILLYLYEEYLMPYVWGKLAKDLPRLKSLNCASTKGSFLFQDISTLLGIKMFSNLRRLELFLYNTSSVQLLWLAQFLERCPRLQDLSLGLHSLKDDDGRRIEMEDVAILHSGLKKVELSGFCGTESEIELALYILKSAACLELMHISRCLKQYAGDGWWIWGSEPFPQWSLGTSKRICERLLGQAISNNARVNIQHQVLRDDNYWRCGKGVLELEDDDNSNFVE